MSEMKNVRWTSVGEKDGKLYYFKDGKWVAAVDEKGGDTQEITVNPELSGNEEEMVGFQLGDTKYRVSADQSIIKQLVWDEDTHLLTFPPHVLPLKLIWGAGNYIEHFNYQKMLTNVHGWPITVVNNQIQVQFNDSGANVDKVEYILFDGQFTGSMYEDQLDTLNLYYSNYTYDIGYKINDDTFYIRIVMPHSNALQVFFIYKNAVEQMAQSAGIPLGPIETISQLNTQMNVLIEALVNAGMDRYSLYAMLANNTEATKIQVRIDHFGYAEDTFFEVFASGYLMDSPVMIARNPNDVSTNPSLMFLKHFIAFLDDGSAGTMGVTLSL